jgi:hypothetical protein
MYTVCCAVIAILLRRKREKEEPQLRRLYGHKPKKIQNKNDLK